MGILLANSILKDLRALQPKRLTESKRLIKSVAEFVSRIMGSVLAHPFFDELIVNFRRVIFISLRCDLMSDTPLVKDLTKKGVH